MSSHKERRKADKQALKSPPKKKAAKKKPAPKKKEEKPDVEVELDAFDG